MFSNFIYFIIVVLIYSTYHHSGETSFSPGGTLAIFLLLIVLFFWLSRLLFQRVEKQMLTESFSRLDQNFNASVTRQSIMAIILFSVDLYGLNLTAFTGRVNLLAFIPTLQALLFLGLFIFYLSIVWANAYPVHKKLYGSEFSRRAYILSNISFSVPVLLPWLLLSGILDLINALPFEPPKRLLGTAEGEAAYFLLFLVVIAVIGPFIIQKFWQCRPLEAGDTRSRIERLCRKSRLAYRDILYWPLFGGKMITAGVMGLVKKFRYILVTKALLRVLNPEEVDAVIAHEIGHIKKKHLLFYLVFFGGYMLLSYATFDLILFLIITTEPVYRLIIRAGLNQATLTSTIVSLLLIINFVIYFRYIFGYFMRNFERQADAYVFAVTGSGSTLISTLEKIALTSGGPPDKPNWHHFSISERIAYLKKCEADPVWIARHDNKIKKSIAVYMAGLVLLGGLGYKLNFGQTGKKLNNHFYEKVVQRELKKSPQSPNLYNMLGDLYLDNGDFARAIEAYGESIQLAPHNPHALNNLAWLYATCENENFRDPEKALILAEKAVALDQAPHVWDTLAESYYVSGNFEKALEASKSALESAKKNRSYYEKQLKKFTLALEK